MGRIAAIVVLVLIGIAAVIGGSAYWAHEKYRRAGPLSSKTTVVIAKGSGTNAIAARLAEAGIIDDPLIFRLGVRFEGAEGALHAGEYAFTPGISTEEVVAMLTEGRIVFRRLTIPEGLTVSQVLALIAESEGLEGSVGQPPAEGTLLPETYHYAYGDSRRELITRMADAMDKALAELWATRAPDLPLRTPEEALILASIIEKETGVPEERPRVAAVFINRLRQGMRLQSDPTVAYGIAGGAEPLSRPLRRADLDHPSAHNTYLIAGLPPGPIANPGRESLEAALHPVDSDELFFVADGTGGHAFARTLKEHNRNVAKWRKIQKKIRRKRRTKK